MVVNLRPNKFLYVYLLFELSTVEQVNVVICDGGTDGLTSITGVELEEWIEPDCQDGESIKINTSFEPICVPKIVVSASINCYQYEPSSQGQLECGGCDESIHDHSLIPLNTQYKACIDQTTVEYT